MELTPAAQMRQLSRSRAAITSVPAEKSPQNTGTALQTDRLSISRQAVSFVQEQNRIAREIANIIRRFTDNGKTEEQGKTEDEMLAEELKVKQRCQKIAARVMAGDKVPPQDLRYLAENDMQTYKLALAARMMAPKKKPKKWESALEDEEEQTANQTGGPESGGQAAGETAGEAAGAESGGGESGAE